MKKQIKTMRQRRQREGRTNYKKRLRLLISRKSRVVVRKFGKTIVIQLIEYTPKGDQIKITTHSSELKKQGWTHNQGNIPAAYLTGMLFAKKAKKHTKEAILDSGLQPSTKGSRIYAAIKGMNDAGLSVPCSDEIMPPEDRIKGQHITSRVQTAKTLTADFEQIKKKIQEQK